MWKNLDKELSLELHLWRVPRVHVFCRTMQRALPGNSTLRVSSTSRVAGLSARAQVRAWVCAHVPKYT